MLNAFALCSVYQTIAALRSICPPLTCQCGEICLPYETDLNSRLSWSTFLTPSASHLPPHPYPPLNAPLLLCRLNRSGFMSLGTQDEWEEMGVGVGVGVGDRIVCW